MSKKTKDIYISPESGSNFRLKVSYGDDTIDDNEVLALLDHMKDHPEEFTSMAKGRKTRWESKYGYWYTISRTGDHSLEITK